MIFSCSLQLIAYSFIGCLLWVLVYEKLLSKKLSEKKLVWLNGLAGALLSLGMGLLFDRIASSIDFFSCAGIIALIFGLLFDGKTVLICALFGAPLQFIRLFLQGSITFCLTESCSILLIGIIFFIIRRNLLGEKKPRTEFCAFSALFVTAFYLVLYPIVSYLAGETVSAPVFSYAPEMVLINEIAAVATFRIAQKVFSSVREEKGEEEKRFSRFTFAAVLLMLVGTGLLLYGFMTVIYKSIAMEAISDNIEDALYYFAMAEDRGLDFSDIKRVCDTEKLIVTDEDGIILHENGLFEQGKLDIPGITSEFEEEKFYTDEIDDRKFLFSYVKTGKYYIFCFDDFTNTYMYRKPVIVLFLSMELIALYIAVIFIAIRIQKGFVAEAETISESLGRLTGGYTPKKESAEYSMLGGSLTKNMKGYVDLISDEMKFASDIQKQSLPMPQYMQNGVAIRTAIRPARQVCGDFYDYFMLDANRTVFLIADVSGKGMSAAMFMMRAKAAFRSTASEEITIESLLEKVNKNLVEGNSEGMFVTVFLGIIDSATGHVQYVNAGQGSPMYRSAGEEYRMLTDIPEVPLGILPEKKYTVKTLDMRPGSRLILYTDGVTEANNPKEEMFGEERLLSFLNENCRTETGKATVESLQEELDRFSDTAEQHDDIAVLVVDYFGSCDALPYTQEAFPAEDAKLDEAVAYIESCLACHEVDAVSETRINLAFEELFVNVAHYAYADKKGNVSIGVASDGNIALVRLTDSGIPFNPLLKRKNSEEVPLKERQEGGLGIFMVKELMNYVRYEYSGQNNIFTMIKVIK